MRPQGSPCRWQAYGMGSVSPDSKLPQLKVLAPAMAEPPVITDLKSQNKSVPFPETCVSGFVPHATQLESLSRKYHETEPHRRSGERVRRSTSRRVGRLGGPWKVLTEKMWLGRPVLVIFNLP